MSSLADVIAEQQAIIDAERARIAASLLSMQAAVQAAQDAHAAVQDTGEAAIAAAEAIIAEARRRVGAAAVPGAIGEISQRVIDPSRQVLFRRYHGGGRYSRYIRNTVLGARARIDFVADSRINAPMFQAPSYDLTCDGVAVASVRPAPGSKLGTFDVDLSSVADGWHLFDIVASSGAETTTPYWMLVHKGGPLPAQDWAPAQTGSYGHAHEERWVAKWARLPAQITSTGQPIALRNAVPFSHAAKPAELFRRDLSPCIDGDPPYLHWIEPGTLSCMNVHGYAWSTMTEKIPGVVLRDGPRGIGTIVGATHLEMGSAAPPSIGFVGNVYFTDSWRFGKVRATGEVVTLAGYRHTLAGLELVGDWSVIPPDRRGFHELWGMAWDERTFPTDDAAAPIPEERNLRPHLTGVVAFVADSQNNRVCRIEFDPRSHRTPAKVTEFIVGLKDPWDVVCESGVLYVSERQAHRVVAYDATTGQLLRVVLQGQGGATINKLRTASRAIDLASARAQPCLLPEGLFLLDGWLYVGSLAQQQVTRVNLTTGELQPVARLDTLDPKTTFFKIAVSDGTFGPRGSVFVSTWDLDVQGGPYAFLPDGTRWTYWTAGSHEVRQGRGGKWRGLGYSTACGVGFGRLLIGSADYGLVEITLATSADPPAIDRVQHAAGRAEYESAGYRLTHGVDGHGQFGYPLPWGKSAAMDYYLAAQNHAAP